MEIGMQIYNSIPPYNESLSDTRYRIYKPCGVRYYFHQGMVVQKFPGQFAENQFDEINISLKLTGVAYPECLNFICTGDKSILIINRIEYFSAVYLFHVLKTVKSIFDQRSAISYNIMVVPCSL